MRGAFVIFASLAFSTLAASHAWSDGSRLNPPESSNGEKLEFIFPGNIDCRDFDRTAYKVWQLRDRLFLDLGNWDGAFEIRGPISPRLFVKRGFDLFDILQIKCGLVA